MSRHRIMHETPEASSSSDDEEDVFSALARRGKGKKPPPLKKPKPSHPDVSGTEDSTATKRKNIPDTVLPVPQTSSTKRHHGGTKNRQDLDSLLEELQQESQTIQWNATTTPGGSYVPIDKETTTTNLFIGNLAPTTTQEQLTQLFGQFGDLHSIKIMWPRQEGASSNSLNAFVCFVHREDAENALEAFDEMDPFGTGHVLTFSWGKPMLQDNSTAKPYDSDKEEDLAWHRPGDCNRRQGELNQQEQEQFDRMFRTHLSASRNAICEAMAFCFEKSTAAHHIFTLWKPILLQIKAPDSVDTLIARLYLLSDVLYNSQQPGIRNAFLYRDFVEQVSGEFFHTMGTHARRVFGRMKHDRLTGAVQKTLGAWAGWGVYDPTFLYEMQCEYEGIDAKVNRRKEVPNEAGAAKYLTESETTAEGERYEHDGEGESAEADDIDGEQLQEGDLDGISIGSRDWYENGMDFFDDAVER